MKLNYNKLLELPLRSNCANWKGVYIYNNNIGNWNADQFRGNVEILLNYFSPPILMSLCWNYSVSTV